MSTDKQKSPSSDPLQEGVTDDLLPVLYHELKRMARSKMAKERSDHTLQTTALVHEVYLRLYGKGEISFSNRAHFFSIAGEAMRRILVEWARLKNRDKRGAGAKHESFDDENYQLHPKPDELIEVDAALIKVQEKDPVMADIIILRYFVGLSVSETAEIHNMSERSVSRIWTSAKLWLSKEINDA